MTLIILVLTLLTAGCSHTMYVKEGGTQQQFDADKFACEQKAVRMYGDYAQMQMGDTMMARDDDWRRCMFSKGYRETTEKEVKGDTTLNNQNGQGSPQN